MRIPHRAQRLLTLALLLISVLSTSIVAPQPANASTTMRSGVLHIVHGDPMPGSSAPTIVRYSLWEDGQRYTELSIPDAVLAVAGGEQALREREVTVRGTTRSTRFDVSSISVKQSSDDAPFAAAAGIAALSGSQKWRTILCKFADISAEPKAPSWFDALISGGSTSYPGLDHYWREVSYNTINIGGSTVTGWHTLVGTRASYFSGQNANLTKLGEDCAAAAGGAAAISGYLGVNFMFNADLDCCAWGGSMPLYGTGYKVTWMPVWGWSDHRILAHEMGHGYGLPHSSGPYGQVYDSEWDVMSSGGGCAVTDAQYGCVGVHTNAYYKDTLGWIASANKTIVTPGATPASFNLAPLNASAPSGSLHMIRIPIQGSNTQFYVVEARRLSGYDQNVPGDAVILHRVNTSQNEIPAKVVDVDNDSDPNDAGAMWLPGETFIDATNDIAVEINGFSSGTYQVTVRCNACAPVIDAEIVSASGPASVTQGQTATISAQVRNNGSAQATFSVGVGKNPAGFSDSQQVTLNAGQSQSVQFSWATTSQTATGNHTLTVSTSLPGDSVPGNNSTSRTVRVDAAPSHDAEIVSLTGPARVVQGGTAELTAQVRNNGNVTETITVGIEKSPAGHSESQSVTLAAGASQAVQFSWPTTAQTTVANHVFTATATVNGDSNAGNNSKTHSVQVEVLPSVPVIDVEIVSASGPSSVTQGQPATISAQVRNNGTASAAFSVAIGKNPSGFSDSQAVTLAAGASQTVSFTWPTSGQTTTGNDAFTITAMLAGDTISGNNAATHTVRVDEPDAPPPPAVIDAEIISLDGPDNLTQGQTATLSAQVRNNGTAQATVTVAIGTSPAGFSDSATVTLAAGQSRTVSFSWPTTTGTATGKYDFTATVALSGDSVAGNNTKSHAVNLILQESHDAEIESANGPSSVVMGDTAAVSAVVRNNSTTTSTITVSISKEPAGFSASQSVTLAAGATHTVTFDWLTDEQTPAGEHVFTVTASLAGDSVASNDVKSATVRVDAADVPPPPVEPQTLSVEITVKCFQIDATGSLTNDRCNNATLHGQNGTTADGYRYTFSAIPVPIDASLVLFPANSGPCQVDRLALQQQADGVQSFEQEQICTSWDGTEQSIQNVPHFGATWARTDLAVASGTAARTWLWGPYAYSGFMAEPYQEASGSATPYGWQGFTDAGPAWTGGYRLVIYLDKTRMEITHPEAEDDGLWYVTNGLLVVELTSGRVQLGHDMFEQRTAAEVHVAGDGDDASGPTYATFGMLRDATATPDGATLVHRVSRDGTVTPDATLAAYGITAAQRVAVPGIDHQVASVFWEYMNSTGVVYENGAFTVEPLFDNPFYATGLPITEAYWAHVKIGGTYKDVLVQCFERRCLTYTPDNPEGWKVEAGNVGQHYYAWRYE